jgi:hypothetical protein
MSEQLVSGWLIICTHALYIHCDHNTLRPKTRGSGFDKVGVVDCGGVNTHFISACVEQCPNITNRTHSSTNSERDKDLASNTLNRFNRGITLFMTGGNIEKGNFIRALLVIAPGYLDRIAGISNPYKINTLNNSALINVEAGNNATRKWH